MKNPLKTFPPNFDGRDFVIGDLHGSYSVFMNLLKHLGFDPAVDRMFSVSDLVDRGPDSLKCLSLVRQPWFHTVLANHEQMMLEKFTGGPFGYSWFRNGGQWGTEAWNDYNLVYNQQSTERIPSDTSMELIDLLPLVAELPFLITVNMPSGKKFHIIHAELPTNAGTITDTDLSDPDTVYRLATLQRGDGDAFLWYRRLFNPFYDADLSNHAKLVRTAKHLIKDQTSQVFNENLSHIISGHTIVRAPLTIVGQTDIDTGAFASYYEPPQPYSRHTPPPKWAGLTCVELGTWKFYQATESRFGEISPVVITEHDILMCDS